MVETFGQPSVCRVQSGNYKEAQQLAEKAMALERDELGSRPERMSELYFLLAYVQDEVVLQRQLIKTPFPSGTGHFSVYLEKCAPNLHKLNSEKSNGEARSLSMIDTCRVSLIGDNAAKSSITHDIMGNRYIVLLAFVQNYSVRKIGVKYIADP